MKIQEVAPGQVIECDPGRVELVAPDPNTKEFIKTILAQNEMVLKMNTELVKVIVHPLWLVESKE